MRASISECAGDAEMHIDRQRPEMVSRIFMKVPLDGEVGIGHVTAAMILRYFDP
jgi:hypothetical protein